MRHLYENCLKIQMYRSAQQETVVLIQNMLLLNVQRGKKVFLLHQCTNISRKCLSTQTAGVAQICNKNVYNSHFLQSHKIALEKKKKNHKKSKRQS